MTHQKLLDLGSCLTVAATLVLFVVALFVKGLTHDLLLEAGVFLVSAKLVIMNYKTGLATDDIRKNLDAIRKRLDNRNGDAVNPR